MLEGKGEWLVEALVAAEDAVVVAVMSCVGGGGIGGPPVMWRVMGWTRAL